MINILRPKRFCARHSCVDRVRACIEPQSSGISGLFAPDTHAWLSACSEEIPFANHRFPDDTTIYTVPLLGITNRPLPGFRKAGFNLFKTLVKISAPAGVKKLDQCRIEFSPRFPITVAGFMDELNRQFCASNGGLRKKNRLIIYSPEMSGLAVDTDLETLRVCVLKTIPAINIDWLDTENNWDVMWNPCSHLKSIIEKLEAKLIKFLDQVIEQVCASRCNVMTDNPGSFFDITYLPYRHDNNLPVVIKIDHYKVPYYSTTGSSNLSLTLVDN